MIAPDRPVIARILITPVGLRRAEGHALGGISFDLVLGADKVGLADAVVAWSQE